MRDTAQPERLKLMSLNRHGRVVPASLHRALNTPAEASDKARGNPEERPAPKGAYTMREMRETGPSFQRANRSVGSRWYRRVTSPRTVAH